MVQNGCSLPIGLGLPPKLLYSFRACSVQCTARHWIGSIRRASYFKACEQESLEEKSRVSWAL